MENIRLYWNKIRIWFLKTFTNKVKVIDLKDKEGKTNRVTVEKQLEKTCQHKRLEEISPTMWKCLDCPDVYFQIGYKVILTKNDLIEYLEGIASHLKTTLSEKIDEAE